MFLSGGGVIDQTVGGGRVKPRAQPDPNTRDGLMARDSFVVAFYTLFDESALSINAGFKPYPVNTHWR